MGVDISSGQPMEVDALGEPGGIWKAQRPGEISPDRLFDAKSLACDQAGNIYALLNQNVVRGYGPDKKMLWEMESTSFCNVGDVDPDSDGDSIHTGNWHHTRRTDDNPGGPEWKLTGAAFSNNPATQEWYDGASDQIIQMRRLGGRLFKDPLLRHESVRRILTRLANAHRLSGPNAAPHYISLAGQWGFPLDRRTGYHGGWLACR